MTSIKNLIKLIWSNTLGLPLGIKLFFAAGGITFLLGNLGFESRVAWAAALVVVIGFTCFFKFFVRNTEVIEP